ncbi:FtsX-like permease family protein [Stackebrandtia soli]|uniref:FtsX-like permease family protein n=1 Tax=Stackebrandtia soli TaxID=1892856 RepID=UPI0039E8C21E
MTSLKLAWRLVRAGGWRALLAQTLTIAAVVLATALLLFAVSGNYAFADRADRTTWRQADSVPESDATAIEAYAIDYVDDLPYSRIDLAAIPGEVAPVPPGLDRFPAPGEVWVSPALRDLIGNLPNDRLADRFGDITGVLGDEALAHADELVVVVGNKADSPAMTAQRFGPGSTFIADFDSGRTADPYGLYRALMGIATVLMVVPLLVFGGASARLTVARRDERLATLRLIGATPGQVVRMTAVEAVIAAFVGAIGGTLLYLAATPLLAQIPIDGASWFVGDLIPPPLWIAGSLVAVPLLVGVSAVIGLRRVVVSRPGSPRGRRLRRCECSGSRGSSCSGRRSSSSLERYRAVTPSAPS